MVKPKLDTELHGGYASFRFCGTVSISDDTFPKEDTTSASGWKYRRANFPVKISDSNSLYVQLMGGRASTNPVVYVRNKEDQPIQLKWDMRNNEDVLKNVKPADFIVIRIEEGADGKLIAKKFVSEVDAIDYLADHLTDGTKVHIGGDVEYQRYNGEIQRSFNITRITLAKEDVEPYAVMQQTYLVDTHSLPRKWEKELEENHQIKINTFVPQYVGKENGKTIKRTLAMPQQITLKATDDNLDKRIKIVEKMFKVDKKVVRELILQNNVVYGYEQTSGEIEMTPELQELVELGIMTEEQIKNEVTVTGSKVDEVVFDHPVLRKDGDGDYSKLYGFDRYAPEALIVPDDEEEQGMSDDEKVFEDDVESGSDDSSDADDPFSDDELFA